MNRRLIACCCCAFSITVVVHAKPHGAYWVEVPIVDDPGDSTDLTGQRSFDLFVQMESDDIVYAMDSGQAAGNSGIALGPGQDFFQHEFGGDKALHPDFDALFPDIRYDSRFQMGTAAYDEYQFSFTPDWNPAGVDTQLFVAIVNEMPIPAQPTAGGAFWFGRFTINSAGAFGEDTSALGEYLGGAIFLSGSGSNGNFGMEIPVEDGLVMVPNAFAVPTPASAAMLVALTVMRGSRRRR